MIHELRTYPIQVGKTPQFLKTFAETRLHATRFGRAWSAVSLGQQRAMRRRMEIRLSPDLSAEAHRAKAEAQSA